MINFGYTPDHDEIAFYKSRLNPMYGAQVAALATEDDGQDVFLYRALMKAVSQVATLRKRWIQEGRLVSCNQSSIGSCVGVSDGRCNSLETALDIYLRGQAEEFKAMVSGECCYGLGREAGGMLGRGDGSYGSAQAKADTTLGLVFAMKHLGVDLTEYSVDRCREYGVKGVPADLKAVAREHTLKASVNVKDAQDAWTIIRTGHPVQQCSSVGWDGTRDAEGFTKQNGSWGHAMCICGRRTTPGGNRLFLIQNSWGTYASGGLYLDQPFGSFYASWESVDKAIKQGDSFTKCDVNGFKITAMDWADW